MSAEKSTRIIMADGSEACGMVVHLSWRIIFGFIERNNLRILIRLASDDALRDPVKKLIEREIATVLAEERIGLPMSVILNAIEKLHEENPE